LATKDTEGGLGRGETAMQKPPQMVVQGRRAGEGEAAGNGGELGDGNHRRTTVQGLSSVDRHREEEGGNGILVASRATASGGADEPGGLSPRAEEAGAGRNGGARTKRARGSSRMRLESEDSCDDQQSTPPRWSPESGPTQRKRFKWTEEEENLLCATVSKFGSSDWQAIKKVTYLLPSPRLPPRAPPPRANFPPPVHAPPFPRRFWRAPQQHGYAGMIQHGGVFRPLGSSQQLFCFSAERGRGVIHPCPLFFTRLIPTHPSKLFLRKWEACAIQGCSASVGRSVEVGSSVPSPNSPSIEPPPLKKNLLAERHVLRRICREEQCCPSMKSCYIDLVRACGSPRTSHSSPRAQAHAHPPYILTFARASHALLLNHSPFHLAQPQKEASMTPAPPGPTRLGPCRRRQRP
jgi:hypothetical protein